MHNDDDDDGGDNNNDVVRIQNLSRILSHFSWQFWMTVFHHFSSVFLGKVPAHKIRQAPFKFSVTPTEIVLTSGLVIKSNNYEGQ